MQFEVEQKYPLDDLKQFERRLAGLGARSAGEPELQIDTYYAHPVRDFALTDEALRIRRVGPHSYLTYKGPKIDATTKTRREIELPLADGADAFDELLLALGFRRVAEVRKERKPFELDWQNRTVAVGLDQVDGLGAFVELELMADERSLNEAREVLASLAAQLQLARAERRSYLELLLGSSAPDQPA